jgi:hypothetical protein
VAASKRAEQVLSRLPAGDVVGAEIGIWKGKMSHWLLRRPNLTLYMVDSWLPIPALFEHGFTEQGQEQNKISALMATHFATDRRIVLNFDSEIAAIRVPDESLDFVFIDADHSYDGVSKDIRVWMPKLKRGGLLSGHDYDNPNEVNGKEVKRAVDDAVSLNGWTLDKGFESTWFIRMPK